MYLPESGFGLSICRSTGRARQHLGRSRAGRTHGASPPPRHPTESLVRTKAARTPARRCAGAVHTTGIEAGDEKATGTSGHHRASTQHGRGADSEEQNTMTEKAQVGTKAQKQPRNERAHRAHRAIRGSGAASVSKRELGNGVAGPRPLPALQCGRGFPVARAPLEPGWSERRDRRRSRKNCRGPGGGRMWPRLAVLLAPAFLSLALSALPFLVPEALAAAGNATGQPLLFGRAEVGGIVYVQLTGIADPDGIDNDSFTYQWVQVDSEGNRTDISGATDSTYTPTAAEANLAVGVTVSFMDNDGNAESRSSGRYPGRIVRFDADVNIRNLSSALPATTCSVPSFTGRTRIWTGVLTVGVYASGSRTFYHGFDEDAGSRDVPIGSIPANQRTFSIEGTDYSIDEVSVQDGSSIRGLLRFFTTVRMAQDHKTGLRLHVCDDSFDFSSAQDVHTRRGEYRWPNSGLDWRTHGSRTLYMSIDTPLLESATVDGTTLKLKYGEALNTTAPAATAYGVKVDGGSATNPSTVSIAGDTVTLTLGTAVTIGQSVTLTYTKPATNPVQDTGGAEARSFTDQDVTNQSGGTPNTAPTAANGTVTTNEDTAYTFAASDFGFNDTDTGDTLASVKVTTLPAAGTGTLALSGTAVTLNQEVTKAQIDANSLTYTPPANANGTGYASFGFKVNDGTDESAAAYTMTINVTAVNDAATGFPAITGTVQVNQTLTATLGTIADVDVLPTTAFPTGYNFQWRRRAPGSTGSVAITGATSSTYTVVAGDVDHTISVRVGFTDGAGNNETRTSGMTAAVVDAANAAPTAANGTVTTTEDTAYTFAASDFGFNDTDTGDTLASVKVTTLPASGTGTLALSGTAVTLNQEVTKAQIDANSLTYTPPANANGTGYASFGFKVNDGTDESAAAYTMTINVTPVNDAATGAPTITGTAQVDQALTANQGTIADVDRLPATFPDDYSFQWIQVDGGTETDISGATLRTYTLAAADAGKTVKVRVSFTDSAGNAEARTSAAHPGSGTISAGPSPTTCNTPTLPGRTVIATTTVTVGNAGGGYGFSTHTSPSFGSLSGDSSFTISPTSYAIWRISVQTGGANDEGFSVSLERKLGGIARARLQVHVCDQTFSTTEAAEHHNSGTRYTYHFANSGLDWSNETTRTVRFSVPTTPEPVALVTNFSQEQDSSNDTSNPRAMRFSTGSSNGGYWLSSIGLISEDAGGDSFSATLCPTDENGYPPVAPTDVPAYSSCVALTPPASFAAGGLTFAAPSNTRLAPSTTYTLVLLKGSGVSRVKYDATQSTAEDSSSASGWTIGNRYEFYHSSGEWRMSSTPRTLRIAVRGRTAASGPVSSDATLSALALSDGTLSPAFSSTVEDYMASVGIPVSRITVTPTTNVASIVDFAGTAISGPTVAYLDGDDRPLADADANTDGFQVNLSIGDNPIKVRVTAEDGNTTKTYTVIVNSPVDPALDLAVDGEVTAGAGDRYFFTRDDFKFKESGGTALRKIYINSLPDDGWLWVKGWRLEPRHLPVSVRVDSLDYEVVLYFAPNGSTPRATTFAFDVSAGRLKSESNYTMTVNIAPRGVEPVIPGDTVIQSTIGQLTYPVAQEVDATRSVAQPLTTGMNDPAYDLGSIVVQFADPPGTGTPDFALYAAVDGGSFGLPMPGTKITDLEEGSAEGKLRTFTPASAVDLAAGTTYFVVFRASGGSIKLASTASKHDDDGFTHVTIDRYARAGPWGEWTRPTTRLRAKMALLDEVFEFSVEADPPTVEGTPVLSGAGDDGTWSEGETVRVALTFSESVDVDTSAGTPSVGIDLGAAGTTETERSAEYESGSGTSTLTFAYTLVAGDGSHTSMAVTPDSLTLGGGTIRSSETAFDALLGHVGAAAMGSNARSTGPQANFHNVPENHDGETPFTLTVAFGGAPDGLSPKRDAGSTFEVEGGAITKSRQAPGQSSGTWELTVRPSGTGGVTLRVPARSCGEAHAVCINGRALPEAAEVTIAGTQGTDNAITAQVTAASASHDGSASFEIEFEFSHAPRSLSYRTVRDDLFDVTGGRIANASRLTRGESLGWRLTVQPDGDGAVTVSARATSNCEAAYAVCDAEGRMFDGGLEHTVPGPASEPESETLPVVSIAAGETPVNEGTDLSFTLSRTGSTDDALTVNVTVSESGDVLAGAPPTSVTFAAGSATATLSVATVDDETEEDASTVTATLAAGSDYAVDSDAGAAEGQVESEDLAPITARFTKVVDEHGGSGTFLLRFAFSHEPAGYSYKTVHNHLFDVTGGAIERARRLVQGSNLGWELRVAPAGFDEVSLSARATTDCAADYAACDALGRKFDGRLSTTTQGPPTLSVADATVEEAEGATLDFAVTLSRAVTETVTVGYATSNGSATAGSDYTETTGTLTFAAHETSKTMSVPVLDDAHDEGAETMTFTLSSPSPERVKLDEASAEGTITNNGRMPQAWTARFGRTVAEQAMEAVEGRFTAPRAPGRSGRIAGLSLAALTGEAEAHDADTEDGVETLSDWLAGEDTREPEARTLTGRELLTGSSFAMTGGSADAGFASFWGRGAVTRFDGRQREMTLDGEVSNAMLGADFSRDALVAGLMVSHARGAGDYRSPAGDGEVESTLTALFPYGRIERSERLALWGMAGYGAGTLTLTPVGAAALRPDLSFLMGAVGARGVLAGGDGGSVLALKSDAMAARTSTDAVSGSEGGNLAAAEGQVTRLRLALEGSHPVRLGASAVLTPSLELGVRHDGGDAETGFGTDIGAGLALSDPARGLTADIRARGLLTHEAGGFGARGLSGTLLFDPAPETEQGLSVNLTQTMGGASWGGADALLGRTTLAGLGAEREGDLDARRLDARIGYGFGVFEDRYTAIPELGLGLGNAGRELRLGWRLAERVSSGLAFELGVQGTRREQTDATQAEHGLTVGAGWRLIGRGAGSFEVRVEAARRDAANDDASPEHTVGARLDARW